MKLSSLLPVLWPLVLLSFSFAQTGLGQKLSEQRQTEAVLLASRRRLALLRAQAVDGRLEKLEYQALLKDFAAITSLQASDPFRDPKAPTPSTVQVASLVTALQDALAEPVEDGGPPRLEFLSVSPGAQQRLGPFVMTEFGLNLRGRFRSIPGFLRLMAQLARHRRLAISIGELRLDSSNIDPVSGEGLTISLLIRAYFRD